MVECTQRPLKVRVPAKLGRFNDFRAEVCSSETQSGTPSRVSRAPKSGSKVAQAQGKGHGPWPVLLDPPLAAIVSAK